jgi:hypothetical protein
MKTCVYLAQQMMFVQFYHYTSIKNKEGHYVWLLQKIAPPIWWG